MAPKSLPILSDYDISPVTGFLPAEPPLQILPDPYFAPWEETFQQFNGLLLASRLRQRAQEVDSKKMNDRKHTFCLPSPPMSFYILYYFYCYCFCYCCHTKCHRLVLLTMRSGLSLSYYTLIPLIAPCARCLPSKDQGWATSGLSNFVHALPRLCLGQARGRCWGI